MKNRVLFYSLTAATIGWGCCFGGLMLSAQEQKQPPREFQGDRPRPKGQPSPDQQGGRPDRQGDRPPDGSRPAEGGGAGGAGGSYQGRPGSGSLMMRMAGRILIVAPGAEAQVQQEVEEDMTTMLHLVERTIEKDLGSSGEELNNFRNIPSVLTSDSRATYLDDYGVLFSLRTPHVLNGPANAEKPTAQPGPRGNQWERARQELYGNRSGEGEREMRSGPMQYDAVKVSALKESLLGLLRDASNLRHLKADQTVAIILSGSPSLGMRPPASQPSEGATEGSPLERFRTQLSRSTSLVLRAKKGDIDAFAQGKLTVEQFKAKVSMVNN